MPLLPIKTADMMKTFVDGSGWKADALGQASPKDEYKQAFI